MQGSCLHSFSGRFLRYPIIRTSLPKPLIGLLSRQHLERRGKNNGSFKQQQQKDAVNKLLLGKENKSQGAKSYTRNRLFGGKLLPFQVAALMLIKGSCFFKKGFPKRKCLFLHFNWVLFQDMQKILLLHSFLSSKSSSW